jgi:hypothetical protein
MQQRWNHKALFSLLLYFHCSPGDIHTPTAHPDLYLLLLLRVCLSELQMAGVLLNKVGGAAHGVWLAEALSAAWQQQRLQRQVQVLGCIPKVITTQWRCGLLSSVSQWC